MAETSVWLELESLYRSDFSQFVRVARAVTNDPDSALEAVQEGFADALRNAGQWKDEGPLEGWVWRCVVNRARKTRRRPVVATWGDERRDGSDDAGDSDLRARLAAVPALLRRSRVSRDRVRAGDRGGHGVGDPARRARRVA